MHISYKLRAVYRHLASQWIFIGALAYREDSNTIKLSVFI